MALKIWYAFVIVTANIFAEHVLYALKVCSAGGVFKTPYQVTCIVEPNESLCFVCPISKSDINTSWKRGNKPIFRAGHNVAQGNFKKNACHSTFHSLKVEEGGIDQHNEVFTCSSRNAVHDIYKYTVYIEASAELYIQETLNGSVLNKSFISIHQEIPLKCVLQKGFGNLNLTWEINGTKTLVDRFQSDNNRNGTYISTFKYNNTEVPGNVTCRSTGPFIRDGSVSSIFATTTHSRKPTDSRKNFIIAIVLLAFSGAIGAFYLYKKKYSGISSKSHTTKLELSDVPDEHVKSSPKDRVVTYAQVAAKPTHTDDVMEAQIGVVLEQHIKRTSKFEYWKGKWIKKPHEEKTCFIKTLNDENTLKTASNFKILAENLISLQAHANIVTVLSIFTDEVPYSVYYEQMEFGTLRDILITRYQECRSSQINDDKTTSSPIDSKGQTDKLVSFSHDIAEAMAYITSQNFSHPVLCARKVLLTEHDRCKLYDIYPTKMAILKINNVMNKKYPPVAWLAPETIFLKEYSFASDTWNFAIVLWEIFSVGNIPYEGMSQKQVEQNIKQSVTLSQPPCCPGAIFSMMMSCWVTSRTKRPTFDTIKCQLADLVMS